jgi:hypothetical protein
MRLEDRKILKLIERIEKQKQQAKPSLIPEQKRIESVERSSSLVTS